MSHSHAKKYNNEFKVDLISSILNNNEIAAISAIKSNPASVLSIHAESGMSAPMLALWLDRNTILKAIFEFAGSEVDFRHQTNDELTLLELALIKQDRDLIDMVQGYYEHWAPHILNNPEP